jgi:hypothetical protein
MKRLKDLQVWLHFVEVDDQGFTTYVCDDLPELKFRVYPCRREVDICLIDDNEDGPYHNKVHPLFKILFDPGFASVHNIVDGVIQNRRERTDLELKMSHMGHAVIGDDRWMLLRLLLGKIPGLPIDCPEEFIEDMEPGTSILMEELEHLTNRLRNEYVFDGIDMWEYRVSMISTVTGPEGEYERVTLFLAHVDDPNEDC